MKLPDGYRRVPPPALGGPDEDVGEEIRFHVESRIEELVAEGVSEDDPWRPATR